MEPGAFSAVSAVTQCEPGRFLAEVDPEWTIAGKPNGGYLLSMLARAATSMCAHPHVTAVSAHYLHSPKPGPVVITAELLRAGRSASQLRARMEQDGQACVEALVTASELGSDTTPYWDRGLPEISQSDYADCLRLTPRLPNGNRVAILEQIEVRLDPDSAGFAAPAERTGRAEGMARAARGRGVRPGLAHVRGRRVPARHVRHRVLGLGADPGADRLRAGRPGPRTGPGAAPRAADRQRASRRVVLRLGQRGRLVAHGTQLAGIRLGS